MLQQEFEISKTLKKLTPEVSLITNLENLKYGILSDSSNEQICKILLELSFTDDLIMEHLQIN